MDKFYEIPLTPEPQSFGISLGGKEYRLRVTWNAQPEGGWILDINRADGSGSILAGIPLVAGCNLLEQFEYLEIGGELWVDSELPPGLANLGADSRLIFVTRETGS